MSRILIIGATSAVATATARIYAGRGDRLFLIARNPGSLAALVAELGDAVVGYATADFMRDFDANAALIANATGALGGLDIALIAHGALGDQLLSESDFAEARFQLDVNLTSTISFLIPLGNYFEQHTGGQLAVMSSVAAERGRPRNYTYAAAKAGLNTYLEGMRSRLWRTGTRVQILKLGPVDTPMTVDHEKNFSFSSADAVAWGIVRGIDRGAQQVFVPGWWQPVMAVVRWLPEAIFQRIGFLSGR
jgi:decaprenylphospho-beta-D-erythro-pentofuranosid-2-ulose 2-reductase